MWLKLWTILSLFGSLSYGKDLRSNSQSRDLNRFTQIALDNDIAMRQSEGKLVLNENGEYSNFNSK